MLLGLRSNFHSAVSEVKMTDRHLKGAIRQGEVMDTHSDDLYMPLLGAETGTVRDGLWADKGSQPQRPGDS